MTEYEGDIVQRLAKLVELRDSGALSESEFQAVKARVLGTADGAQRKQAVVAELLAYANEPHTTLDGQPLDFTTNAAANEFVRSDPFAFLCAVIFDQGIPAEKAWMAPHLLRKRLGYFGPQQFAENEEAVAKAVRQPPALHRYVEITPRWIVLAARRVLGSYGGDAGMIWAGNLDAAELRQRFDAFVGIGQKKAAMAVEILARDLGVPVRNLGGSDIAYDVHVRRVFLRTHLAETDNPDHMIAVARQLHPARPGALDLPAWLVGRNWCHPGIPDCAACRLVRVCPKDVERGAQVIGG